MQTLLRYRGYVIEACICAILFGAYVLYDRRPQPELISIATPTATLAPTPAPLVVHVVGEVVHPGVYALPANSRLIQAVEAAGGLTGAADVASVNLADYAHDGQQVRIPAVGDTTSAPSPTPGSQTVSQADASVPVSGQVNLNTATLSELDTLPGIGPVYAQRIIDYREANGPFTDVAQVMEIKGIGPATYERIKDRITVH